MSEVKLDISNIEKLIKKLKIEIPPVNVGIIGSKNARTGENTNAEIGLYHEYGTDNMPQRSFLRMPLTEKFNVMLNSGNYLNKDFLENFVKDNGLEQLSETIGTIGVAAIMEAFETGGFGTWKETKHTNKTGQILVDTQQLRNSITYEVKT